jgi:hypothetical protein
MNNNKLFLQKLLTENVLFLDGLGRAGKNLLCKVTSNFNRIEYFQYIPILEHIPILYYLKKFTKEDSLAYFKTMLNMHVYDRVIGRNLNMRVADSSSILNSTELNIYKKRSEENKVTNAVKDLIKSQRIPSFMVHECMPHIDFISEACPRFRMINIQRHPVDIVSSWYHKGWGERFGIDPLAFIPVIEKNGIGVPWFANSWCDEYVNMTPINRTIKSVITLYKLDKNAYNRFSKKEEHVLLINYEEFFAKPELVIDKISTFLNTNYFDNMTQVLNREGCPKNIPLLERKEKLSFLTSKSDPLLIKELIEVSQGYEDTWKILSCLK